MRYQVFPANAGMAGGADNSLEGGCMYQRRRFPIRPVVLAAALVAVGCTDALGPERGARGASSFDAAASDGIALDRQVSTVGARPAGDQRRIVKGFNPINPQNGVVIVATFFWLGSTDVIDSVTDHLTNSQFTPVGNPYTLVEYVTAGGISMATYVATNVQGIPVANEAQDNVYAVQANLSADVTRGGVLLSAWSGAGAVSTEQASASGSAATTVVAHPGAVGVAAGDLVYGVTMATPPVGMAPPPAPFKSIDPFGAIGDDVIKADGEYAVQAGPGQVDPEWLWAFDADKPGTWLATALVLNPAGGGPPPTTGDLTVTTITTGANLDPDGYTVNVERVSAPDPSDHVETNGSVTFTGLEPGDYTVTLSDVAANCTVTGDNPSWVTVAAGETAATTFVVTCTAGATRLVFTQQPGNALPYPLGTIPTVKVTAVDAQGNRACCYSGQVTIAIGRNAGLLLPGTLRGTKTVAAVNGVATFSNLSIDRPGIGYTLVATASGLTGAESAPFTILTPLSFP